MDNKNIAVKLTKHAKIKIKERNISLNIIEKIISNPEMIENDKIDESLVHFIGKVDGRYLRIIGRRDSKNSFLVISSFFDRRIKKINN
ncbi:MAG: DUF4258 domain-containing protein [bacterium]